MNNKQAHTWSIDETERLLQTSAHGLSAEEVHKRRRIYGKNVFEEESPSILHIFLRQFNNPIIYILLIASFVSVLLNEIPDFFIITGIVLINAIIGFVQEIRANASLAALRKFTETKNIVIREGRMKIVPGSDLVPGDFIILDQGEVVTADIRLTDSSQLMIDESLITGESTPVPKNPQEVLDEKTHPYEWINMAIIGSTVVQGRGHGIVVRTGKDTYLASLGARAKEPAPISPLQSCLQSFTQRYIFILIALVTCVATVGYFQGRLLSDLLYILLASIVSAVPEGLPFVITLAMIRGAILLKDKHTLVRDLPSVETLGSTTVIATDKTGTITEGKLLVASTYGKDIPKMKRIGVLCNNARDSFGDPLDVALTNWVDDSHDIRAAYKKRWEHPFDPKLMLMATIHSVDNKDTLYVKGAYESLRRMAEGQRNLGEFDEAFQDLLKKGHRILAFAEGLHATHDPTQWKLHIIGLVGFVDPPKKGVHHAVATARKAGIRVIMVTGDHPTTAQTIAHEVGIWKTGNSILTGKEIETFSEENLLTKLQESTVLARIIPEHKHKIVKILQQGNEIVAVTGDGINDMPALKAAHIGIAMGNGAEAAKGVSKMILTDNNFSVIVDAIKNARIISANIRKAIYYLVSTSIQELCFLCLSIFSTLPVCLSAIQILWINLVTDGVIDKTFPFTQEEGDVMKKQPQKTETAFFDATQIKKIFYFGTSQGVFCFFLYAYLTTQYSFDIVSTIIFTSIVMAQLANGIQAQKETEPFFYNIRRSATINPFVFISAFLGFALQWSAIYLFPSLFGTVSLPYALWIYPFSSFCFAFFAVEIEKWMHWKQTKRTVI